MDRRDFLRQGLQLGAAASALAGLGLPTPVLAQSAAQSVAQGSGFDLTRGSRVLSLARPQSGERLHLEYLRDGQWVGDAYNRLCWLLRDIHVNQHVAMDPELIGLLDWTQWYLGQYGYTRPLQILSGYRTRYTNQRLENAAKNSMHLYGKAIDLRVPGLSAEYLGKLFWWMGRGGVGIYTRSEFVHIDTGAIRAWRG